jgi:hypothetical protein
LGEHLSFHSPAIWRQSRQLNLGIAFSKKVATPLFLEKDDGLARRIVRQARSGGQG